MVFDWNFVWGIILGAVVVGGIWFLRTHKKPSLKGIKRPPMPSFKKVPQIAFLGEAPKHNKIEQVDDTPPDSDWPNSTYKNGVGVAHKPWWSLGKKNKPVETQINSDARFEALEAEIAKLREVNNKTVAEDITPEEKARLAALEESNPLG